MNQRKRGMRVAAGMMLLWAATCFAGDWPNWRGPNYNGATDETNLPETFSSTENVLWTAALPGSSAATPVVWGDRVFVSSANGEQGLLALCFARDTGSLVWMKLASVANHNHKLNNQASPSPAVDGKRALFHYGNGDLVAYDFAGNVLWSRNVEKEYGTLAFKYVYSTSPLLHEGRIYIPVLRNTNSQRYRQAQPQLPTLDSYLLCLDAQTGKEVWKFSRPSDADDESLEAYTTAIPFVHNGRQEIVVMGGDYLTGHDPASGKEFWRVCYNPTHMGKQRVVPSAVCGGGLIFASQPKGGFIFGVKAGLTGSHSLDDATAVAWKQRDRTPDVAAPLLYRERLYYLDSNRKMLTCAKPATGEILWQEELGVNGICRASPTAADGKIYLISMNGEAVVLQAGDTFKKLCQTNLGGKGNQASIAISQGQLFVRTSEKLFCIGKR